MTRHDAILGPSDQTPHEDESALVLADASSLFAPNPSGTRDAQGFSWPAAVYLARLAPGSRRAMRQGLAVLAAMLAPGVAVEPERFPWWRVSYAHAQALRSLLAERYSPATCNRILAALRQVLVECRRLGLMSAEQSAAACDVKCVRGSRVQRGRALSPDELRALFRACDTATGPGARDAALLAVLYAAGLRRAEAAALRWRDLDLDEGTLCVRGKGDRERRVPLAGAARAALRSWRAHALGARVAFDEQEPMFCAYTRNARSSRAGLTPQSVLEIVQRLAVRAKIRGFSPHDLRRTYIGDLLDAGADLSIVQQLAGHAQVTTTARYDRRGERARRRAAELLQVPFGVSA